MNAELSPTERLRAAEALLREVAGAATPGPWTGGDKTIQSFAKRVATALHRYRATPAAPAVNEGGDGRG